jgi:hypothetical protein
MLNVSAIARPLSTPSSAICWSMCASASVERNAMISPGSWKSTSAAKNVALFTKFDFVRARYASAVASSVPPMQ